MTQKENSRIYCQRHYKKHRAAILTRCKTQRVLNHESVLKRERVYRQKNRQKLSARASARDREIRSLPIHAEKHERLKAKSRRLYQKNRAAMIARRKEYRTNNIEKAKASDQASYLKRKEKILAQKKEYRTTAKYHQWLIGNRGKRRRESEAYRKALGKEFWRQYQLHWRQSNPSVWKVIGRRWRQRNPDKVRSQVNLRRARKLKARIGSPKEIQAFYLSVQQAEQIICHWCGKGAPKGHRHVDHKIPLAKGGAHCVSNLVGSCDKCNLSKGTKMPDEFLKIVKVA